MPASFSLLSVTVVVVVVVVADDVGRYRHRYRASPYRIPVRGPARPGSVPFRLVHLMAGD